MANTSLAVLLTCFNRKQKTLDCLEALYKQSLPSNLALHIYLVDDGSTDGTSEAIQQGHPQVNIIKGNGNLFWTGDMRLSFAKALQESHDYYLWLNDDTMLYPNALSNLLSTAGSLRKQGHSRTIVVGSTQDSNTGKLTYGGVIKGNWLRPCRFSWVAPGSEAQPCDTIKGNCVLLPYDVVEVVGNLDATFTHYGADFDYGLRARQKGCSVWIAPDFVGTCGFNDPKAHVRADGLKEQLQKLHHPKGLPTSDATLHPLQEWKVFTRRYAGPF